jgi:carotenoid cleavage dioxygenase-like enzyme
MPRPTEHPYLTGNYAPVPDETSITDLAVEGELPPGLVGQYLQIGPNPIGNPARPYVWSEADGMVHAVTIHAGRPPSYRNRWVITAHASRRLGTEPVPGDAPDGTDVINAIVVAVRDRVVALGEHAAYELGPDLETRRRTSPPPDCWRKRVVTDRSSQRYAFSTRQTTGMPFDGTELLKHDLLTGSVERHDFGGGRHPGQLVFVSDTARGDGAGWLVGLVHDDNTALAELVVLDATEFRSPALATVHINRRVPYGLHCAWAPIPSTPRIPSTQTERS